MTSTPGSRSRPGTSIGADARRPVAPVAPPRSVSIRILLGSRESSRQSAQSRNGMVLIRPMWLVVRGSALAVCARGLGQVEGRIAVEEADGLEGEPAVFDRHDRPVLWGREGSR